MKNSATIIESLKAIAQYSFTNANGGFSEATHEAESLKHKVNKAIAETHFKPSIQAKYDAFTDELDMLHFDFEQELGYAIYMAYQGYYDTLVYQAENPNWKQNQEDDEVWCTMLDVNDWLAFFMEEGRVAELSHMIGASGDQFPLAKYMMANKPHVVKVVAKAVCNHNKLLMKARTQPTVATYTIGDVF